MKAPGYEWWHRYYECKKRYNHFMEEALEPIHANRKVHRAEDYPNATGGTEKPPKVVPRK